MKLLAIDTSTEACSAALSCNGGIKSRFELAPQRHANLILPMVNDLMSEAQLSLQQLDGLAFCRGPGAFTGVRIATSVIQGLAFAADLPVIPVSSLATLAQGIKEKSCPVVAAIDARMGEIYYATYLQNNYGVVKLIGNENISLPENLTLPDIDTCYGVGSGWKTYHERLSLLLGNQVSGFDGQRYPCAADAIILAVEEFNQGNHVPAERVSPVYLRNKVVG